MKIDAKQILGRLAETKRNDRTKVSLYLSKELYETFKRICGEIPASQVVEDLMRQFVESVKKK